MTASDPSRGRKGSTALRIAAVAMTALLCAALYFGLILMDRDDPSAGEAEEEWQSKAPLQPGQYDSVAAVRAVVDFPLIALNEACIARAENAEWQGRRAHLVTMNFASGIVITAVSPREAAPLIKRSGLELAGNTDLSVVGMDAVLATGPSGACLYFASGSGAYCLYGEGMTGEQVLNAGMGLTSRNVY